MGAARRLATAVFCLLAASAAGAQGVDPAGLGARRDTLRLVDGPAFRLAPGVVPGSLGLRLLQTDSAGARPLRPLTPDEYTLDPRAGALTLLLPDSLLADSALAVAAAYRVLDLGLRDVYTRRVDSVRAPPGADEQIPRPGAPATTVEADPLFGDTRLRRSGSITRGLIAGSNRDLAVESGLRMELAGEVAEGVSVEAVLTDASTPILPEGTTQQLSEFDRVFVRITTRAVEARLGDVDLALTGSRFAELTRRVQGAAVEARIGPAGPLLGGRVLAAGAAARGLFRSQPITPVEGVQGPYRLTGRAGETFVLVVPNSERVYLDGARLERGEHADYVIDYATGEITFTPRRLITSERRITVDFEYTAGGFTRTLLAGMAEARLLPRADGTAGLRLQATALREGDAAGLDLGLSPSELDALAAAGVGGDVLVPGWERVPFDPESPFVLYTRRDTLVGGAVYRVFVPATADADSVFRVRFSRVEAGRGSYRRLGAVQNGLRYEWVGPTGGDYIPLRRLVPPEQRSLLDLRAEAAPLPGLDVWAEWAASALDRNTLSPFDAAAAGQAAEAGATLRPLALGRAGALDGRVRFGRRAAAFAPLDRTRAVDFSRTWNLDRGGFGALDVDTLSESVAEGALRWALAERSSVSVEGGALGLDDPAGGDFRAARAAVEAALEETAALGGILPQLAYRLDYAATDDGLTPDTLGGGRVRGAFLRQRGRLAKPVWGGRLVPSVEVEQERRAQRGPDGRVLGGTVGDTLSSPYAAALPASYGFLAVRPGLGWATGALTASASVEAREEQEPLDGALVTAARALGAEATARWRPGGSYSAEGRLAFRRRRFEEAFRALGREDGESLALRWTARAAPLRRAVEATATYEALTERAPVLQETYVLVGPELGTHVWRDGQGEPRAGEPDGVAQVDEFFPEATPLEGSYARTFVPGDRLFPAVGVQAQLRLRLDPARFVARTDARPAARLARALSLQTTVDVRERTREDDLLRVLLLDPGVLQRPGPSGDTLAGTLAGRFRLQQELSVLADDPRRGARLSWAALSTTNRLAAGLERRRLREANAEGRLAAGGSVGLRLRGGWSRDHAESDAFASRSFDLTTWRLEPEAVWTPAAGASLTLGAVVATKSNADALPGQAAGARLFRLPVEARWARVGRLALTARAERADVRLDPGSGPGQGPGTPGGLLTYELTEGRGPGVSYLWGLVAEYTLTRYLRASAFYDGRAPADAPVVHTFRMQVAATF